MNERYYTADDMEVHEKFIKIPIILFESEYYKYMSDSSKVAYGALTDRQSLSYKNREKWTDDEGRVYIIYTNKELQKFLTKSEKSIIKIKKELIDKGLLLERRQGFQKPNLLYPQKPKFMTCNNDSSCTVDNAVLELETLQSMTCNNDSSCTVKNSVLELEKLQPNQTNINQTNNNQTDSSRSSSSNNILSELVEKFEKNFGRMMSPFELEDMEKLVREENFSPEIIEEAMRESVLNGKPIWKYMLSILNRYKREGLLTVELVRAQREAWDRQHGKQRPVSNPAGNIPTWSRSHPDHPEHAKYLEEEERRLNQKSVRDMTDEEFEALQEEIRNTVFDDGG